MDDLTLAEEVFVMAVETEGRRFGHQQLPVRRGVRVMAGGAVAVSGRHMASLFTNEQILVMTGEAEFRCVSNQQLRDITAVRVMAGGAFPCRYRRVQCLILEFRLVVTVEAQIRHLRRQEFPVFRDMDVVAGCAITCGNRGMLNFSRKLVLIVADETEVRAFCRQEFRCLMLCRMGVCMAGNTAPGYHDRVHILALCLFLMTAVTEGLGLGIGRRKTGQCYQED